MATCFPQRIVSLQPSASVILSEIGAANRLVACTRYCEEVLPGIVAHRNAMFDQMAAGIEPKPGPQIDRQFSAPVGGPTTLTTFSGKGGTPRQGAAALSDAEAKRPGEPASNRAAPEPKPPLGEKAK